MPRRWNAARSILGMMLLLVAWPLVWARLLFGVGDWLPMWSGALVMWTVTVPYLLYLVPALTAASRRQEGARKRAVGSVLLAAVMCAFLLSSAVLFWDPHATAMGVCRENMVALEMAIFQYAEDNDLQLPDVGNWVEEISPYVPDESVFRCPEDQSKGRCSYAMNANLRGKSLGDASTDTVLLYEVSRSGDSPSGLGQDQPSPPRHHSRRSGRPAGWNWATWVDGSTHTVSPEDSPDLVW
jgi:hypothetical protein